MALFEIPYTIDTFVVCVHMHPSCHRQIIRPGVDNVVAVHVVFRHLPENVSVDLYDGHFPPDKLQILWGDFLFAQPRDNTVRDFLLGGFFVLQPVKKTVSTIILT